MFRKNNSNFTGINIPFPLNSGHSNISIPAFFIIRMVIWFAMSIMVAIASLTFCLVSKKLDASLVMGMLLTSLMLYKGFELLHIAQTKKYFVLELECVEIKERNLKDVCNIWDPTSQTAFRRTTLVNFTDEGGTRLQFIFDVGRRFVVGSTYNFYFRRPQNDGIPITIEMLEQLKIDHEVKAIQVTGIATSKPIEATSGAEKQQG